MVIVGGRNFFAEDIEATVRTLPGVHRGRCVAFADQDRERVVVVAESADNSPDLVHGIRAAVSAACDLGAVDVHQVPPGTLPRTSSGKWQRLRTARLLREMTGGGAAGS